MRLRKEQGPGGQYKKLQQGGNERVKTVLLGLVRQACDRDTSDLYFLRSRGR